MEDLPQRDSELLMNHSLVFIAFSAFWWLCESMDSGVNLKSTFDRSGGNVALPRLFRN